MLITLASHLSSFLECKYYSFSSVLVGVIFFQVNPTGNPQQVADLILRCQILIQSVGYTSTFTQSSVFELLKNVYFAMVWCQILAARKCSKHGVLLGKVPP